ncbi:MAG TPA: hypothetical protein ENK19_09345 [Acidobacteria bacterium]|nr:hypothetical protein [Acidobacteriota bacterium]
MSPDAKVSDALIAIADSLQRLGNANADTDFGAIEALSKAVLDSGERVADALGYIADSIDRLAEAISKASATR